MACTTRPLFACMYFGPLFLSAKKIDMQEQQIRQLEHHVAQLKDSLQAGGLISKSVTSADGVAAEAGGGGGVAVHAGNQGADGDLP